MSAKHFQTQVLIVGGGPAGLATACTLQRAGYDCLVLERGTFAEGVAKFPYYMRFFSTSPLVELCGFALTITDEKPTREQYLRYLHRFVSEMKLDVKTRHTLEAIDGDDGAFCARGQTEAGKTFEVQCEKVVLATGAYDHPNPLDVPGEELPKVSHYYTEINDYIGQKVLIVGGRHSASETALELYRAGIDVTICHRQETFSKLKYWIGPDLENRIKEGSIKAHMSSVVTEIKPESVTLRNAAGESIEIENDRVLALTGYHPNPDFLEPLGVRTRPDRRQPIFDPQTFESTRAGIYLVGVMLAGNISGAIFIENSRHHGEVVRKHLGSILSPAREPYATA